MIHRLIPSGELAAKKFRKNWFFLISFAFLGNKCDMQDKRVVSKDRGETIAREHGIRFLETSAKANINIDRAFLDLAEAILTKVRFLCPFSIIWTNLLTLIRNSKLLVSYNKTSKIRLTSQSLNQSQLSPSAVTFK